MSEENTQPAVETAAEENKIPTVELTIGGVTIVHEQHAKKQKGKDVFLPVVVPQVNAKSLDQVLALARHVGVENFVNTFYKEVWRSAAMEASGEAIKDDTFNGVKYLEALKDAFDPRKSSSKGPKKAEIYARQGAIAEELTALIVKAAEGNLDEADQNRIAQIQLEMARLSELLAKKERRGKAPAPAKAA